MTTPTHPDSDSASSYSMTKYNDGGDFDAMIDQVLEAEHDFDLECAIGEIFLAEAAPGMIETTRPVQSSHADQVPLSLASNAISTHRLALQQPESKPTVDHSGSEAEEEEEMDRPKRSLSAYNLFFQAERKRLLQTLPDCRSQGKKKPRKSHGKLGFADMARTISARWKSITPQEKAPYDELAKVDTMRYKRQMALWKEHQCKTFRNKNNAITQSSSKFAQGGAAAGVVTPQSFFNPAASFSQISDLFHNMTPQEEQQGESISETGFSRFAQSFFAV